MSVKNLPSMQETWVLFLGQEDPLEKRMTTPVFLPGEFHGQRSLSGYRPSDCKELDTTERLTLSQKKSLGWDCRKHNLLRKCGKEEPGKE